MSTANDTLIDTAERLIKLFNEDKTCYRFMRDDGEGGFVGSVYRMARHIDALESLNKRQSTETNNG